MTEGGIVFKAFSALCSMKFSLTFLSKEKVSWNHDTQHNDISIMILSIATISIMTLSIRTLSMFLNETLSIMTLIYFMVSVANTLIYYAAFV